LAEAFKLALKIFLEYWWFIPPVALFFIFRGLHLDYIRTKYINSLKWVLLEVKIPKEVVKTPKAMEQIFAGLHGTEGSLGFVEKWFKGEVPDWFSLEIIGKGGDVHFLIRTLEEYRNLVEAQIYAQYPDAEIAEVEDYTNALPKNIPSDDYDIWGTELLLTKEDAYPIRTYPYFFEEAKEEERIDPLASLSEILSSLSPDEHIWIQILISATNDKWKEDGEKLVEKLIGKKVKVGKKGMILEEAGSWVDATRESLSDLFFGPSKAKETSRKNEERSIENLIMYLTPGQREVVSEIEKNIAKLGFNTIIRFIYWAKSDIFSGANKAAVLGAFKQFNTQNLNGFKKNSKISPSLDYWFVKRREFNRKVSVLYNYKKRYFPHQGFSKRGFVFNTEELATIYHIPGKIVAAPTMPRIEAKKGGPPSSLPIQ